MKEKFKNLFNTKTTLGKIMRVTIVIIILALFCLALYLILKATGLWEKVNSPEKIREIVLKGGAFSFIIFFLFQILQTTVLQIPAFFVTIAGTYIFGLWPTFIMSYLAVMLGSIIMFLIGRKAGKKFLYWLVGKETAEKWINKMGGAKYLYFLMMVFPMFPDDILCVIAGLTNMSFNFFFWTNILARGLGIACTVFFGSGTVIPFHGWGLIVWGIILVFIAILFYLSVRFKDKIDEVVKQIFTRNKKEKTNKDVVNNSANITDENKETANLTTDTLITNKDNLDV